MARHKKEYTQAEIDQYRSDHKRWVKLGEDRAARDMVELVLYILMRRTAASEEKLESVISLAESFLELNELSGPSSLPITYVNDPEVLAIAKRFAERIKK